ncbi:hypothetical protein [Hymenobacter metallilatus]|uniref:Periplasmic heavy metal sensor n=1 Tax=Hymenobacter metallilatus TaxID=2493666 RepID=A0A428JLH1_9BACT|nr:hypothetical protein [Hymenobacter metallilatus]RSK33815.1 hypothetical protein EI290_08885 [Hymenobacter metallilatus]
MKKMLALLIAATALSGNAAAQTTIPAQSRPGGLAQNRQNLSPEQRADRQAQHLTTQLGLSADQTPKVRAIVLAQAQEIETLRDKYTAAGSRQGLGPDLKATQEKYDAQLKAVLTAEQYTAYTQLRADRLEKVRQRRAN